MAARLNGVQRTARHTDRADVMVGRVTPVRAVALPTRHGDATAL